MRRKPLVIEFYAGPGTGKTTHAAGLWHYMKSQKVFSNSFLSRPIEFVRETAQTEIFRRGGLNGVLQSYLLANHIQECIDRENAGAGIIITDTGAGLSFVYKSDEENDAIRGLISYYRRNFSLFKIFLKRTEHSNYRTEGRLHTLEESEELDKIIYQKVAPFDLEVYAGTSPEKLWYMIRDQLC